MTTVAINESLKIFTFEGAQYISLLAHQEITRRLRQDNTDLRARIADKETILTQMGEQLREAIRERWHVKLEKVSVTKCPTPQKKLLAVLVKHGSSQPVRIALLANETGMSISTAQRHLREMVEKRYLARRDGENSDVFYQVNPEIERTPAWIEKVTPVRQRDPNYGGGREKKLRADEIVCDNCGSNRVNGHIHINGVCPDCGAVVDEWREIPDLPTVLLPVVQLPVTPPPVSDPITPPPFMTPVITPRITLPALVAVPQLNLPDKSCLFCGRPRRVCFAEVEPGVWWHTCREY